MSERGMLSRLAESLYWIGRYIERADDTARIVDSYVPVSYTHLLVGLGSMALGLVPMAWYWYKGAPYFKMPEKIDRHAQLLALQQMEELL